MNKITRESEMKTAIQEQPCLEIQDITIQVEGKTIIEHFSLTIHPGEVHVLMGPNGSGKSTLAATLIGNPKYTVTQGKILLQGEDITCSKPEERALKGMFLAFQYPFEIAGLQFGQYLFQIVKKKNPLVSFAQFQEKTQKYLDLLSLEKDFLTRELNVGFSGGEKKRAEVLQLLLLEPYLAILDETDSGLDVDALKAVGTALQELRKKTSMLIITHYPRILTYIIPDKVHIFKEGFIITTGAMALAQEVEQKGYGEFIHAKPANN